MIALVILALNAAGNGGMRIFLLLLLLLGIALIVVGCIIAVRTLFKYRRAARAAETTGE